MPAAWIRHWSSASFAATKLLALAYSSAERERARAQELDLVELVRDRLAPAGDLAWRRAFGAALARGERGTQQRRRLQTLLCDWHQRRHLAACVERNANQ